MKKFFSVFILVSLFVAGSAIASWTDPTSSPPGDNSDAPLNISGNAQLKSGGFSLSSLISDTFIKLGATEAVCDVSTEGTVRFKNGLVEVCTNQILGSPIVSVDPGIPATCSADQLTFYNTQTADWECGDVPEELDPCADGEGVVYNSGNWSCQLIQNKFIDGSSANDAVFAELVGIGTLDPQAALHVNSSNDLSFSSTDHPATFGDPSSLNIGIDGNEIMARNNGSISTLHLQQEGGSITVHGNEAESTQFHIEDDGRLGIGDSAASSDAKISIKNTTNQGPAGWYTSIRFTNGSHNAIWNPAGGLYFGLHSDGNFYYGDETGGTHQGYAMIIDSDTGDTTITGDLVLEDTGSEYTTQTNRMIFKTGTEHNLRGNGSGAWYLDSDHNTVSQLILRDSALTNRGRLYGVQNESSGAITFGLLDENGNWSIQAQKDDLINFRVDNDQKMRIKSDGDVGIGVSNPTHRLHVEGNASSYISRIRQGKTDTPSDMLYLQINRASPDTGQGYIRFEDNEGNAHGYITGNNGSGVNFTSLSDQRLKHEIESISYGQSKRLLTESRPVTFNWIGSEDRNSRDIGYIAQELKPVIPEAVFGHENETEVIDEDGEMVEKVKYMTVSKDTIIPVIHSAIVGEILKIERLKDVFGGKVEQRKKLQEKFDLQQKQIDELLTKLSN